MDYCRHGMAWHGWRRLIPDVTTMCLRHARAQSQKDRQRPTHARTCLTRTTDTTTTTSVYTTNQPRSLSLTYVSALCSPETEDESPVVGTGPLLTPPCRSHRSHLSFSSSNNAYSSPSLTPKARAPGDLPIRNTPVVLLSTLLGWVLPENGALGGCLSMWVSTPGVIHAAILSHNHNHNHGLHAAYYLDMSWYPRRA